MSNAVKFVATLPLLALIAACVPAGGNDQVNTISEIEETTDTAISGPTVPGTAGVQTQP